MAVHLQNEIDTLKKDLLTLCAAVEQQVEKAVRALLDGDAKLAEEVEQGDQEIDQQEVEVEEDCLRLLVLYQPVAGDLRLVIAALKINNDLERIGDLAVNIAHKAVSLAQEPAVEIPFDLPGMWSKTRAMLRDSLDAMVRADPRLAKDVCERDDEVDRIKHDARVRIEELIHRDPAATHRLLRLLAASRNLERIADCATNIAEDVIYMVNGRIIRHGRD
jgi:phosphate transport system protein